MYIRRKVFSVALDEYGEERYFSTNEIMSEDDYLDEVMYSDDDDDNYDNLKKGAVAAGAAGAGIYGAKKVGEHLSKNRKGLKGVGDQLRRMGTFKLGPFESDLRNKRQKVGDALQKPADWVVTKVKNGKALLVNKYTGAKRWVSANKLAAAGIAVGAVGLGAAAYYGSKAKEKQESYYDPMEDEYEYMFSKKDKESHTGRNIAIGAGATAAGIYGAKKGGEYLSKSKGLGDRARRLVSHIPGVDARNKRQKIGDALQKPADIIVAKGKDAYKWAGKNKGKTALIAVPAAALAGYGVYRANKD